MRTGCSWSCCVAFFLVGLLAVLQVQAAAQPAPRDYSLTVSTAQPWTDTGIDLQSGDSLKITATAEGCDPQGVSSATASNLPIASAIPGALIAKLQARGTAILVGSIRDIHVAYSGRLFLGVNSSGNPPCEGGFSVKVHLVPAGGTSLGASTAIAVDAKSAAPTTQPSSQADDLKKKLATAAQIWMAGQLSTGTTATGTETSSNVPSAEGGNSATAGNAAATTTAPGTTSLKISDTPLDGALRKELDGLPRRVNDEFNNLGDMVNFALIGSQQQVQGALEAGNWHVADTDNKQAVVQAVLQTYEKKDYLAMPMSKLMLFGRYQDYGYEQAEPIAMVASRHHFRIWKAPFTWNGETVWVGACTHDIGFEKDQRNGRLTHKIDPAVDGERENIGKSLQKSEKVKNLSYYLPPNPMQDAKNATGGGYHSDGRVLVVFLK
jgi:LssY-like putative type I secretion system component LssY